MKLTKSNDIMDVELIEKRDPFYEINKNHLNELWDNVTSKSLVYVSIVFLVYIILVSLTILHETYKVAYLKLRLFWIRSLSLRTMETYREIICGGQ